MTAQASLDAQLETGNSPFADFTQFPESGSDVSLQCFRKRRILMRCIFHLNRAHEINRNHWKMMMVCSFRQDRAFPRSSHRNDLVHLRCIENRHHVTRPRHPIHHWPQNQLVNHIHVLLACTKTIAKIV